MSRGYPIVRLGGVPTVDAGPAPSIWTPFTPAIIVTGAGGVAPTYLTYSGRYMVTCDVCHCDVLLSGDGGVAGSGGVGTQLHVSLPIVPGLDVLGEDTSIIGFVLNSTNYYNLAGLFSGISSYVSLYRWSASNNLTELQGGDQDNATRKIRLHFWYEVSQLPPL